MAVTDRSPTQGWARGVLGLLALFIGCGGDASEVVPGMAADWPGVPVGVEAEARLAVGVREGDTTQEFHDVVTPFLTPDGLLGVPSAGHGEIRLFDQRGNMVAVYGGVGEGPGEFRRMGGAWMRGDTIEALDLALQRITRFLPTGQSELTVLDGPSVIWGVGPVSDGWLLVNLVEPGLVRGNPRDQWAIYWFDEAGQHRSTIGQVEGIRRIAMPGSVAAEAFSPTAQFAVRGGEIYVGETLTPEIRVFELDGTTVRHIVWEPERSATPTEAVTRVREELRARSVVDERVQLLLDAPLPDRIPLFTDLLVDSEGFAWVRSYLPERDAVVLGGTPAVHRNNAGGDWDVFSPRGENVGSITMPRDFAPYFIGSDAVVGVARDSFGVETVRVHSVIRR